MTRILLRWHLGMGDALICNGIVRALVQRGHAVTLPCYSHNVASVAAMFSDLGEAIGLLEVSNDNYPEQESEIKLGYFGNNFDLNRWDESFYRQAGVPFLAKWELYRNAGMKGLIDWDRNSFIKERFIHDDKKRGFIIPIEGYRPERAATLFEHEQEIGWAKEIHCINSCFAILADLEQFGGNLFLHRYARPDGGVLPIMGQRWTILDAPL